ncbi:hypothetical protein [Ralstonia pseudosolanacearum]|uniref:Uncharacterized protein n=1 Tax=Ralstonia solanacearum TaxID=305 RepID=A0AA92EH74_RALSL|nr:hypothetical protein [Ralstonia pseudosolanacearum]QCX51967.1 hypothetical protein E7Z57_23650 [Ralstonia pseudosolanacearum]
MNFEVEGEIAVISPKPGKIKRTIKSLKSYGPSSYASLADDRGRYVQVAGGGITCMVEQFDPKSGVHLRAFHDRPNPVYPDGTILSFRAGNIPMKSDEWFRSDQVAEIFISFLEGEDFPAYVSWRPAPEL